MSVAGFTLYTWFRRVDASGAEEWMLHNVIPLEGEILQATEIPEDELCEHGLQVFAFLDGIVFMSIYGEDILPSWFLSFCLETRKLEKLFKRTYISSLLLLVKCKPIHLLNIIALTLMLQDVRSIC